MASVRTLRPTPRMPPLRLPSAFPWMKALNALFQTRGADFRGNIVNIVQHCQHSFTMLTKFPRKSAHALLAFASSTELAWTVSSQDRARTRHIDVRGKSDCGIAGALVLHDAGARTLRRLHARRCLGPLTAGAGACCSNSQYCEPTM